MVLVYGGFRNFPLGAFTVEERNALDRTLTGANHAISDAAIRDRYHVTMRKPPGPTERWSAAQLRDELSAVGKAYAIAGKYNLVPASLRLSTFAGDHDVCVIPLGNGRVRWLDPLAEMGFAGEIVAVDTVLNYANKPNDARWLKENELAPAHEDDEMTWLPKFKPVPPFIAVTRAGAVLYKGPGRDYPVHFKPPANSRYHVIGVVDRSHDPVALRPDVDSAGRWFLAAQRNYRRPPGFFIAASGIAAKEPVPPAGTT